MFAFPGNYILDKFGLKIGILLNGFFMILGIWIRCLVNYNFWFVILGNAISGIGLNIILTGSPMVAFHWFLPNNTPLITSILMMGQAIGMIVSFWLPKVLTDFDHDKENYSHDKNQMMWMLVKEAIIITIGLIPGMILFKDHPKTPPSETSL